jgi:hypothetical protein
MKLKKILPHLFFLLPVQIIEYDGKEEEILFDGLVDNIPWRFGELKLDTDGNGEAISIFQKEGQQEPILNIYVKTEGKDI